MLVCFKFNYYQVTYKLYIRKWRSRKSNSLKQYRTQEKMRRMQRINLQHQRYKRLYSFCEITGILRSTLCQDWYLSVLSIIEIRKPKYQLGDKYKLELTYEFIKGSGKTRRDVYKKSEENITELRKCFEEEVTKDYDDEACKQKYTQRNLKHHCLCILTTLWLKQRCYRTLVVALRHLKLASTLTSNLNRSLIPTWIFHCKLNARLCRSLLERYKQSPQPNCLTNTLCTHSDKSTILLIWWGVYI